MTLAPPEGFRHVSTGGNCTAWESRSDSGLAIVITDAETQLAPDAETAHFDVAVLLDGECEPLASTTVTSVDAALAWLEGR